MGIAGTFNISDPGAGDSNVVVQHKADYIEMTSSSRGLSSQGATVLAALIGAIFGSIGGILLESELEFRERESVARELLVQRYVSQLQESAESLWWRVNNGYREGKMSEEYYETSTIYALGRVLATDYILVVDGVYPRLLKHCKPLGTFLDEKHLAIQLANRELLSYSQRALAESLIEYRNNSIRVGGYLSFRKVFDAEIWPSDPILMPITQFVQKMRERSEEDQELLDTIWKLVGAAAKCTGVVSRRPDPLAN